jgi:hypothetical protein
MPCAVQLHGRSRVLVGVYAGVLEQLTVVLAALLNLSTLRSNQPKMARRGLQVLLKSNTSLYQIIGSRVRCVHRYSSCGSFNNVSSLLPRVVHHQRFRARTAFHVISIETSAWCRNQRIACALLLVLLQDAPTEAEMKLLDMLAAIIQNMVSEQQHHVRHPAGCRIALVQIIIVVFSLMLAYAWSDLVNG